LQAYVIHEDELGHLQRRFNLKITNHKINELQQTIQRKLVDVAEPIVDVDAASIQLRPKRITAVRRTLSIASNPTVIAERKLAKGAILETFDIDEAPEDIWFEDDRLTGIDIACSDNRNQANTLRG
jgi:hypothetical protein